jgi:hypothetical protein
MVGGTYSLLGRPGRDTQPPFSLSGVHTESAECILMMTTADRVAVLNALWAAVTRLTPPKHHAAVAEIAGAIEVTYNAHGDVRAAEGYADGRRDAETALATARDAGFRDGMIAVKKRSDFRELDVIGDPEELKSRH